MWSSCIVCGSPVDSNMLSITPFGLQAVCDDDCLRQAKNSDAMPPRVKFLYEQQQRELKKESTVDQ